jgi:hypothetical protein
MPINLMEKKFNNLTCVRIIAMHSNSINKQINKLALQIIPSVLIIFQFHVDDFHQCLSEIKLVLF